MMRHSSITVMVANKVYLSISLWHHIYKLIVTHLWTRWEIHLLVPHWKFLRKCTSIFLSSPEISHYWSNNDIPFHEGLNVHLFPPCFTFTACTCTASLLIPHSSLFLTFSSSNFFFLIPSLSFNVKRMLKLQYFDSKSFIQPTVFSCHTLSHHKHFIAISLGSMRWYLIIPLDIHLNLKRI